MADGSSIGYFPGMSRLMGEVDSPTNAAPMTSPQFGGSPEQMMAFLQSPHVQQTLQNWGISFDPSQMRQSQFLPNSIMQHHPMLGRAFTGAASAAAATPEAPLVSGAGSGISRAMQGLMGGNEMQRQYQMRQMMAPMQAIGMQMPEQEFQRKQQLLQLLGHDLDARESQAQAALAQRAALQSQKDEAQQPRITRVDGGAFINQLHSGAPQGGPQGDQFSPQGQSPGRPMTDPSTGQTSMMPGWGLTPEQQAQWSTRFVATDPALINAQHPERAANAGLAGARRDEQQQETQGGMPTAKVGAETALGAQRQGSANLNNARVPTEESRQNELDARAQRERDAANNPGGHYGQARQDKYAAEYNKAEQHAQDQISNVQQLVAMGKLKPDEGERQIQQWRNWLGTQKENIDRGMNKPGQSAREAGTKTTDLPRTVAPIASMGGAQQGGPGSGTNENTTTPLPTAPPAPQQEKQPW
jgi:hypothetical protein